MPNHQMSPLEAAVQSSITASEDLLAAHRHKRQIELFWRGRGFDVQVSVIETADGPVLRSNLRFVFPKAVSA